MTVQAYIKTVCPSLPTFVLRAIVWVVWVVLFGVVGAANDVQAQRSAVRRIGVDWEHGVPEVSFSARDLIDQRGRETLNSGLLRRLVMTIQAFPNGSNRAIATRRVRCSVTYDLWEEAYIVGVQGRRERYSSLDHVMRRCLSANHLPIGTRAAWRPYQNRAVYFLVRAELNPISEHRCRSLLRSSGGSDPVGPIVINIVQREICRAERVIGFRSPSSTVPPP